MTMWWMVVAAAEAAPCDGLDAGEVVLEPLDAAPGVVALKARSLVPAGQQAVWNALLNWDARVRDTGSVKSATTYTPPEGDLGVTWQLEIFGMPITYHNIYDLQPENNAIVHRLDTSKQNDFPLSEGTYRLFTDPRGTCLVYDVATDTGRNLPAMVESWLTGRGMRGFLEDVNRWAVEGGA